MRPTFIVIGAMKSGTTSLYHYLDEHPEVGMSSIKETDYFVLQHNYERGPAWYASLFEGPAKAYGEVSPNYTKRHAFPGVPERMHEALPDVKLVYLLRDPIDRAVSHYIHQYAWRREHRPIDEALADPPQSHYVRCSLYHEQLGHFRRLYNDDRILVASSSDLKTNREAALRTVYGFIGVDDGFVNAEEQRAHKSSDKQRMPVLDRRVRNRYLRFALRPFLPSRITDPQPFEKPVLSDATRDRLAAFLHEDAEKLRSYTGARFEDWSV